ncbi:zinc-dependent metalloprotease [Chryseobacterium paridis]|uniref:Zinc-dependent metalloprotease n=1 Tax=Chryseobacterium paridis TaxID=2800328 RepID=A0ABS1G0Q8_9FLAO|nr:zinc-dependent metalloprotease [Chryseobacterium paridis]MBK1898237.1 zinc-dependent metalloprotease [Chryseobacterium paridis]
MKRIVLCFALMLGVNVFSQNVQNICGFDQIMSQMDAKNPQLKKNREEMEAKLATMNKQSFLNKSGATTAWNGLYTGQVYEIPVVVHVIESQATANANLHLTDQEIINWLDRANKMYATTYGNGFYAEGTGPDGGNVMPFKLVLAKRSPTCEPTTGIIRYNGSTLPSYDTRGVKMQSNNGVADYQIKNELAHHWPENSYFNIYVVIGFDGQQQLSYGLMGYAKFPNSYDYDYESFMKVATVKNQNDTTLTHELGHAFGLYHTFGNADYTIHSGDPGYCPASSGDCTIDDDRICDTEKSGAAYYQFPAPSNSEINPCTNQNYQGVQYNIMNYTNTNRKFTAGQRDRAVLLMMEYRKNLLNSNAGKDPSVVIPSPVTVVAAQCNPAGTAHPTNNNFAIGPYKVSFADINSMSNGYDSDEANPIYYADYSTATCIRPAYYTDLSSTTSTPLKVTYLNGFGQAEKFKTKVWIDYNNNGSFEDSELVVNNTSANPLQSGASITVTNNITVPANAVKNVYLRMRVGVDAATYSSTNLPDFTACSQVQYGQMEDYAVRIVSALGTSEVKESSDTKIVYTKADNKLQLIGGKNAVFGDYQIFDMSGKVLQKGTSKTNEVQINQTLPKGVYIINYSDKKESKKFVNN